MKLCHQDGQYFINQKGILGHCQAFVVISEDHNKITLHYHMFMAGGLNGCVLQCFHAISELSTMITSVLDKMQSARLWNEYLIAHALCKILWESNTYEFDLHKELSIPLYHLLERDNLTTILDPIGAVSYNTFSDAVFNQIRSQQIHDNMRMCKMVVLGRSGCRMCFGWWQHDTTHPILLMTVQDEENRV